MGSSLSLGPFPVESRVPRDAPVRARLECAAAYLRHYGHTQKSLMEMETTGAYGRFCRYTGRGAVPVEVRQAMLLNNIMVDCATVADAGRLRQMAEEIGCIFGPEVLELVRACSDVGGDDDRARKLRAAREGSSGVKVIIAITELDRAYVQHEKICLAYVPWSRDVQRTLDICGLAKDLMPMPEFNIDLTKYAAMIGLALDLYVPPADDAPAADNIGDMFGVADVMFD